MLLAIDTSAGTSVAVVDRDAGILAQFDSVDTRGHAEIIGDFIEKALKHAGIAVTDLSGVVAGMGPGPFAGLRVGIAAARAFAFGAGKPVVPVVSHDAVAFGAAEPVVVVTDARRSEVYWSAYDAPDAQGLPTRIDGPSLSKADGFEPPASAAGYRTLHVAQVSAGDLGLYAEALYANGRPFAADEALYLRSPDVTLSAGPKRVTS
ncbi:tRNA (adenosine(37)-N6)-threonylcarbamoyltransferase complex dimerization subunit type 1 TsaB [soil metagenome]